MKKNYLILLFCCIVPLWGLSQSAKQQAYEKAHEAVALMDAGQIDESLVLLEEARKLDPKNYLYMYEIGYAYYLKKDYEKSLDAFNKTLKYKNVNDQCYQMTGNLYSMTGDAASALKTYDAGLKKFPSSGRLYLEKGNIYWTQENYKTALLSYEKGIEVAPDFPSNYYRAARIYCATSEKIWGVLYGEMFMNLERGSARTEEISALLYHTYSDAIKLSSDTAASVNFSRVSVMEIGKKTLPFAMTYEMTMLQSLFPLMLEKTTELSLKSLTAVRGLFIQQWFSSGHSSTYPNLLFDYHQRLKEAGHFEAYNYWLFMKGEEEATVAWQEAHKKEWRTFIDWFIANPLEVNVSNGFSSNSY